MKRRIKGYIKTRHFKERQKQREVSDLAISEALISGELVENDHGHNFLLGNLKVTVDLVNETLITVHPGDPKTKSQKLLSKEEARKISELIKVHQSTKAPEKEKEEDAFLNYVSEFSVKKL